MDGVDGRGSGKVEVRQPFHTREACLCYPALPPARLALFYFGREHLGQVGAVGEAYLGGVVGQLGCLGAHRGQAEQRGCRTDRGLCCLFGHGAHTAASSASVPSGASSRSS